MGVLTGVNVLFIIILLIFGIVAGVRYYRSSTSKGLGSLIPFSAMQGNKVVTKDKKGPTNNPQIMCPKGKVNIVGAYYSVFDVYSQCSSKATDLGDLCSSKPNNAACKNIDASGKNTTCSTCKSRDVSAQVGTICDGKKSCDLTVDSATLGDYPCKGVSPGDATYTKLPAVEGNSSPEQGYYLHGIYTCVLD